jgi:hypothetical protein
MSSSTFAIPSLPLAAHLAMLGFEVTIVPSRRDPGAFIWLAPAEAQDAARKYTMTIRILADERRERIDGSTGAAGAISTKNPDASDAAGQ